MLVFIDCCGSKYCVSEHSNVNVSIPDREVWNKMKMGRKDWLKYTSYSSLRLFVKLRPLMNCCTLLKLNFGERIKISVLNLL